MWARNLLFVGLIVVGLVGVAAGLLSSDPIKDPIDFQSERFSAPADRAVIDQVDREFNQYWQENELVPAGKADNLTIARRFSLALTGTVPSLEELRIFETVPKEDQLEWYLSRLLEDRRYADYLAERLARAYVGTETAPSWCTVGAVLRLG